MPTAEAQCSTLAQRTPTLPLIYDNQTVVMSTATVDGDTMMQRMPALPLYDAITRQ